MFDVWLNESSLPVQGHCDCCLCCRAASTPCAAPLFKEVAFEGNSTYFQWPSRTAANHLVEPVL